MIDHKHPGPASLSTDPADDDAGETSAEFHVPAASSDDLLARFSRVYVEIQRSFEPLREAVESMKAAQATWEEFGPKVAKVFHELPEKTHLVQAYLSERSWYLSAITTLGETAHLALLIERERHDEIEQFMQDHTRRFFNSTVSQADQFFPGRAYILNQAFRAHSEGMYAVSIPTFLAQIEGICLDLLRFEPYTNKEDKLTKREAIIEGVTLSTWGMLIYKQLARKNALADAKADRDKKRATSTLPTPLNRHAVLHGEDTTYASEANSLRCISMLELLVGLERVFSRRRSSSGRTPENVRSATG